MHSEVTQHIKEASEESNTMFLIPEHPTMRPDVGFVELPAGLGFWASIALLPEHAAVRVANHATIEMRKKEKDVKKVRR